MPEFHRDTLAVRAAVERSAYGENSEALFLTSSFVQPDSATAARRFAGEEDGYIYSRFSNPTVASMEQRLAALEGAERCVATASGMAAILLLCLSQLKAGDHVVCSRSVFGATIKLLGSDLARFGVETTLVSQTDLAQWRAAIRPGRTRLLFAETPTNPLTEVCDIRALADLAHEAGALLAVDNCFATPALQRPMELGADVVVHSGTKYLDGQGRVVAGALCTGEAIAQSCVSTLRSAGMSLSPFNAWVVLKGMETLSLRMQAQSARALELARWLQQHAGIAAVHYPGLPSHPQHALAMAQQSGLGGAVVSFELRASTPEQARARAFHVIDSTRMLSITANLGDVKTLITHPASTSHGRLTEEQRQAAGISQGLIRIAVGLEHLGDIQSDLLRGLETLP
ncbi:O-succinylhomoserine sulfhydrylase [Tibeticola sediminis]|jgi:O-succinylhomoserine sulfhydrylase|uniref:O-succinylhomoserine sulfhydrylase n=2 Tax=Tibeticola TaxID=1940136 RepID=A0A3N4UQ67_9BURK|nr:O-succinylhomoserine sulfhydrylase [Tibeticola sediminis]RPE72782.1 O-succinylhomoserine sulfhydrylase [Tibeticola sediminis]